MTTAITIERRALLLSWANLLRLAAAGQIAGLAAAAVVLRDAEAAAIAVATLIGLFLLRIRGGVVGAALLALLFADTGFFTGAAALTNLADRADWIATAGPAALAAIALPGLLAALVTVKRLGRASTASRLATSVPILAVAALGAISIDALVTGAGPTPAASSVLQLDIKNVSYSVTQLEANGQTVTVRVTNHDLFWHTFTIGDLGVDLRIPVGGTKEVTFTAQTGTYTYLCSVPGHAAQMHGTLTVP